MWNLENQYITGKYLGEFPFTGKVRLSRAAYGGGIKHHIDLVEPITVYGAVRDSIIIGHENVETVFDNY